MGDASIGVGIAGNELLVGNIYGTGNLTKIGAGQLTMEQSASFDGRFRILEGKVRARSNNVRNDLEIAAGAEFAFNGNWAVNQGTANSTVLEGTLCLNDRGAADANAFSANIGSLSGSGAVTTTSTASTQTLTVNSSTEDSSFDGTIAGRIAVVKNGAGTTLFLNGVCNHSEDTVVNAGQLGGTGMLSGNVILQDGAGLTVDFNEPLRIGGTLTFAGDAFQIVLPADVAGINTGVSNVWKVVEAGSVSGFAAENFTIDASAFELDGGMFSISESAGDLYLEFAPAAYSALEQWRFDRFGTYSNTGDAADAADPDGDGFSNLIEYGAGLDPNGFNSNALPILGISGSRMTVTFDRIADPTLTYWVEATSSSLVSNDWNTIWLSTGTSNTTGAVTVEDTELISNHWKRFLRLKLSN
ncbi:hypothetical protein P4E94_15245 [Pontiellaceae bacterium B12219]|nr:hypothetical protein [Pontiellaceae bacterium B12219]